MARLKNPGILQVLPALNTGGVERGTCEIAQAIVEKGWRSYVASTGGKLAPQLEDAGTLHLTVPTLKSHALIFYSAWQLYKIIKKHKIDLVHVRSRAPAWACFYAAKWSKVPLVSTFHGAYGCQNSFKYHYNKVMTWGDKVIAPSQYIAQHIQQIYHVPPSKIDLIYRGVDLNQFNPAHVSKGQIQSIREQWQVKPHDRVFLLPGRFTAIKGHEDLIRAMAPLDQKWKLILMGSWTGKERYLAHIQHLIAELKLADKVKIVPASATIQEAYAAADVVVCPSTKPESFGRTIAEAGAMARPIVTTNIGGGAEIVVPGKTGWLIPSQSIKDLREVIDSILSLDQQKLIDMGLSAQKHVEKKFPLSLMQQKTLAVYEKILH